MSTSTARWLVVSALLSTGALGCDKAQESSQAPDSTHAEASVEGPVVARIVRRAKSDPVLPGVEREKHVGTDVGAGPYPLKPFEGTALEVTKPITLGLKVHTSGSYKLLADDDGKRLARKDGATAWRIIYFGTDGRSFSTTHQLRTADFDWKHVPPLTEALENLFEWFGGNVVIAELRSQAGTAGVVAFMSKKAPLMKHPQRFRTLNCSAKARTLWREAFDDHLNDAERAGVRVAMRAVIQSEDPHPLLLDSAASVVELNDPLLLPDMRRHLNPRTPNSRGTGRTHRALFWLALAEHDQPDQVGRLACAWLGKQEPATDNRQRMDVSAAQVAIARTNSECPHLTADHTMQYDHLCRTPDWWCPQRGQVPEVRCASIANVREQVLTAVGKTDTSRKDWLCKPEKASSLLAALSVQPQLPQELERGLNRQTYRLVAPKSPPCNGTKTKYHQPCHTELAFEGFLSRCTATEVEVASRSTNQGEALLMFDDRAKTVTVVRRDKPTKK